MTMKKLSSTAEPTTTDSQDNASGATGPDVGGDATTNAAASEAEAPPAIPDPIVAVDDDGTERPMSGGSFIRQSDGTLIRNPEA
jgi:hypothetical protein